MFLVSSVAIASTCPAGNRIVDPAAFEWTNRGNYFRGTMEISERTFVIGGETLNTRAYGQIGNLPTLPGPTIYVKPGHKYILRFHNLLPYEAPNPAHNVFKDPNIANLHTHGLHISGESPGDDVTRSFEGGYGGDFVYDIPADHMGGTYWYHAHHHGSTFLQVAGGAFGLIIVDDSADGIPNDVANMKERQLLFAKIDPTAAGTGGDTLMGGSLSTATWTANGIVDGDLCMPVNEWQHFRILVADPASMARDLDVNGQCEVALLARDGVWRTTAPKILTNNRISLTGASRADLAVRCQGDGSITVGGNLVANIYADPALPADTNVGPYDNGATGTEWSAQRPAYLRDLSEETDLNLETINMGARTINGSKFDKNTPNLIVTPEKVQEWDVRGAAQHPFHLHVYHVQAFGCSGDFEDGEYYDVLASNCSLRFDLSAGSPGSTVYDGRTIMHCHILEHEDQGAMGWMQVVETANTIPEPTFPTPEGYAAYYAISEMPRSTPNGPSELRVVPNGTASIRLTWSDRATDEDGFEIERSSGVGFMRIDTVGINATSFVDTGLISNTTYTYRVRAVNGIGPSMYSNTASTQTGDRAPSTSIDTGSNPKTFNER